MRFLQAMILAMFVAPPALGREPPDYIGLMEKAVPLAVAVSSARSCEHFGYTASEQGLRDRMQQIIDEAVSAGMPAYGADMMVAAAIQDEDKRQAERTADMEARKSDPAALENFLDYWEARCARLAADPVYGAYFRR